MSDDWALSSSAIEMRDYEREVQRDAIRVPKALQGLALTEEQIDEALDDTRDERRED